MMEPGGLEEGRLAKSRWALLAVNLLIASVLVWLTGSSSRIFQETLRDLRMTNQLPILSLPVFWTPWQVQVGISLALLALTMAKEALFKRHYSALNANILQTAIGTLVLIWYMTALLLPFMFYSSAREHRP